jgi:hypothetical protein
MQAVSLINDKKRQEVSRTDKKRQEVIKSDKNSKKSDKNLINRIIKVHKYAFNYSYTEKNEQIPKNKYSLK